MVLAAASMPSGAQNPPMLNETVARYDWVRPRADFVRCTVMIPMRDGTKLHTVMVFHKCVKDRGQKITEILPIADGPFVDDGYIRVYLDVRGLHSSEGEYVMGRALRGPLNATAVDHATDAYDTIDWLVRNVPEGNGRVGSPDCRTSVLPR